MSDVVLCGHICDDDAHNFVEKRYGMAGPEGAALIEFYPMIHADPGCDGLCPGCGREYIKLGMTKLHLMGPDCHSKTEAEASALMNQPRFVRTASARRFLDSFAE